LQDQRRLAGKPFNKQHGRQQQQQQRRQDPAPSSSRQQPQASTSSQQQRDPDAMDVDRRKTTGQGDRSKVKCYKCGFFGHIARDCKSKRGMDIKAMTKDERDELAEELKKLDFGKKTT
jgi:Zinc knuckle